MKVSPGSRLSLRLWLRRGRCRSRRCRIVCAEHEVRGNHDGDRNSPDDDISIACHHDLLGYCLPTGRTNGRFQYVRAPSSLPTGGDTSQ
jgi:hypothetical protein